MATTISPTSRTPGEAEMRRAISRAETQIGAQLGVQRLEFQRVLLAQREFGDAVIAAGLLHQPLGFEQPFAKAQGRGRFVQHGCRPLKHGE